MSFAYRQQPQPIAVLQVRLPRELVRLIRKAARAAGVSVENYVARILDQHFNKSGSAAPSRSGLLPHKGA